MRVGGGKKWVIHAKFFLLVYDDDDGDDEGFVKKMKVNRWGGMWKAYRKKK